MERPRRLWHRRRFRVAVAIAAVIASVAAAPFVFTTSIVRYYLAHSDYAAFNITLDSASLSPVGRLVLRNVAVHDIQEHSGKPLLAISTARIDFSWGQLRRNHLKLIDVQGLKLYLRPAADAPFSLLRLAAPAPASTRPASSAPPASPLWFDQLIVTGTVQTEGFDPWSQLIPESVRSEMPLRIHVQTSGNALLPTREFAIVCGDPDASDFSPALAAKFTLKSDSLGNTDLAVSNFSIRHASISLAPEILNQLMPTFASLPADLRRRYELSLDSLQFNGKISLGARSRLTGDVTLRNMDLVARSDGIPLSLDSLSLTAHLDTPLTADAVKDMHISGSTFAFDSIQYGPWRLARGSANFEFTDGTFTLAQSQAAFAGGSLICSADWPLSSSLPSRGSVYLRDTNVTQILTRMPDDFRKKIPLTVTGLASAKLTFANENLPSFTGRVELSTGENFQIESPGGSLPGAMVLTNATVAGQFLWSGNFNEFPEITNGRFRADAVSAASVNLTEISAGLQFQDRSVVVDTLRAAIGDLGALNGEARLDVTTGILESASLSAQNIPASLAERWLPPELHLDAAVNVTATLQHPEAAPTSYALASTISLPAQSKLRYNNGAGSTAGPLTLTLGAQVDRDFRSNLSINATLASPQPIVLDDALLAQFIAPSTLKFNGGVSISLDHLTFTGKIPPDFSTFSGKLELAKLATHAVFEDQSSLALDNLTFSSPCEIPLTGSDFSAILTAARMTPASLGFDHLVYGKNTIDGFAASLSLEKGQLSVTSGTHFSFASGTVTATADIDLLTPALDASTITFSKIEQSIISRSILPERFSAEGPVSGEIVFARNIRNQLAGSITLASDSPGRLVLNRDLSQKLLAPAIKAAAVSGDTIIPPTFDQIVTSQLANYTYSSGKISARDLGGDIELVLDYTHTPLVSGDPGYGVKLKVAGVDEILNYPVHLQGLTFMLRKMTVTDIVLQAFGFVDVLVKPLAPPASQPSTQPTSQPATQPATMPTTAPATTLPRKSPN